MRKQSQFYSFALAALMALALAVPAQAFEAHVGPTGVLKYDANKALDGYTLFAPNMSKMTYLIDNEGQIVHTWKSNHTPGRYATLLPNGNLLRGVQYRHKDGSLVRPAPLAANWGALQELDWDGNVVWEYKMINDDITAHHGYYRMPNGNTLLLGFERVSKKEAKKLGRKNIFKGSVKLGKESTDAFWLDFVREVTPKGKIAWEWHLKDHLGTGKNKVNFNYMLPKATGAAYSSFDWSHANTVNYLADKDQILVNFRNLAEFILIDHKTGKILDRFGNDTTWNPKANKPSFVDSGDQVVFGPHSAHRIPEGLPGAGHFLIFDNGSENPEVQHSRVIEVDMKTKKIVWQYQSKVANSFASQRQGSVQRLPNGNTFVCSANHGHLFEVTPDKKIVWDFVNPVHKGGKVKILTSDEVDGRHFAHGGGTNMVHRSYKYATDFPGLQGKDLSPKGYIAGDDAPVFYKAWKRGAMLDAAASAIDDEDEEDGPAMHAY